jgi:intracellular sulfur oxidation DsrE/DsrF family protein
MSVELSARRSFMSRMGAAFAAFGIGSAASAEAQTKPAAPAAAGRAFRAAHHAQDDWMDQFPGKHRIVIDAVTPHGAGEAVLFANNLYVSHKTAYDLADKDLAIVVVMRHFATPFAFTDAVWAKYGKAMGDMLPFKDPKTKESPTTNLYQAAGYGLALPNLGTTIETVRKKGTYIAICDQATRFTAQGVAGMTGSTMDAVYKDFQANIVPDSRFVPAGVLAVARAQEKGYTLIYAG